MWSVLVLSEAQVTKIESLKLSPPGTTSADWLRDQVVNVIDVREPREKWRKLKSRRTREFK